MSKSAMKNWSFLDGGVREASTPTNHKMNIDHGKNNSFHNDFLLSIFKTKNCINKRKKSIFIEDDERLWKLGWSLKLCAVNHWNSGKNWISTFSYWLSCFNVHFFLRCNALSNPYIYWRLLKLTSSQLPLIIPGSGIMNLSEILKSDLSQ